MLVLDFAVRPRRCYHSCSGRATRPPFITVDAGTTGAWSVKFPDFYLRGSLGDTTDYLVLHTPWDLYDARP